MAQQLSYKLKKSQITGMILIAFFGTLMVFSGLVVMNHISAAKEAKDVSTVVNFDVPEPPPPPPPPKEKTVKRTMKKQSARKMAPLPDLGSSLSGISVSLTGFDAGAMDNISDDLLGNMDDVAFIEDAVDDPPSFRTRVLPEYPARAKQRGIEGSVTVSVLVGTDGIMKDYQILEASPEGVFEDAVVLALRQSTFEPASYKGTPVESWVNIPFPFRLQ